MEKRFLEASKRLIETKHSVRELRKKGRIPGVIYGSKVGSIPLSIAEKDLKGLGGSQLVEIKLPEATYPAIVRELQRHPLKGHVSHVDFQQVDLDKAIRAEVPVSLTGTPVGLGQGGVLQHGERSVTIEALPDELPDNLEADISPLTIGDKFTVADLQRQREDKGLKGLAIVSEPDEVLAMVVAPRAIEVDEEPAGGEKATEESPTEENTGE